jgi:hypothetical protein
MFFTRFRVTLSARVTPSTSRVRIPSTMNSMLPERVKLTVEQR